jgi:ceramide glucosyltransferase
MTYLFITFALILIWLSAKSLRGGFRYLDHFRRETERRPSAFTPFATVIAPCRGLDHDLEANLASLFAQDYPAYEIVLVVDDGRDPSVPVIERLMARSAVAAKLIVAAKAANSAQKVENLREGVQHACDASQILVFVDSDARPSKQWLRSLTAPLEDESVGAATGYRWFISNEPSFASEMRSAWNASIASALGPDSKSNFCWGGSTAIRREIFERLGIRDRWRGTLSDDFTVTSVLRESGMPILFVPQALTPSFGNCTVRELLSFTTRQMKITRVYAPQLWLLSLLGSALFNGVMLASLAIVWLASHNDFLVFAAIATASIVSLLSLGKAWLRLKAVRRAMPEYRPQLRRQAWTQYTFWLLTPALFLFNSIAALFSRTIEWRGIRYRLNSPRETVIISE